MNFIDGSDLAWIDKLNFTRIRGNKISHLNIPIPVRADSDEWVDLMCFIIVKGHLK